MIVGVCWLIFALSFLYLPFVATIELAILAIANWTR